MKILALLLKKVLWSKFELLTPKNLEVIRQKCERVHANNLEGCHVS